MTGLIRSTLSHRQLEHLPPEVFQPHPSNPRKHSKKQIRQIADSIKTFGFQTPVLVDAQNRLICGHGRVQAAKLLGMEHVPVLRATGLSESQVTALMIADNRLTEISQWDDQLLGEHFKALTELDLDFDLEVTGFDYGQIEQFISEVVEEEDLSDDEADEADDAPDPDTVSSVTHVGDLWLLPLGDADTVTTDPLKQAQLGRVHRLLCADATEAASYDRVMDGRQASMIFSDPPYNLAASDIGQVCADKHGDFAMASGEMTPEAFTDFLGTVMQQLCRVSVNGSIHYLFMDWRHAPEILTAGLKHYSAFKNLCVWVKDRPGMGSFYRSQHELVFIFKHGDAKHQNHFELGQYGRTRSNIWRHPSVRSLRKQDGDPSSEEALAMHPTIKPVRLIEEALQDCSRRGQIVLDPFLGSGSTLIACEKKQRQCFGMELSPRYVDVAITRWQRWTGRQAIHAESGKTYDELMQQRKQEVDHV